LNASVVNDPERPFATLQSMQRERFIRPES
jgi:hypothetical protein